ncbi:TPA: hypothetical protein K8J16_001169 [Serratia marcescens]|uniref:hypothetical protein n=1 Tax=Serratia marcescens TaxID=615 RepID=UPI001C76EE2D|nr:hypothetical protein [Serratia marcescens]BCZ39796.1 hypothetical protein SMGES_11220 [Serratia marcescens]HBI6266469.1 hypothetical protein [Serratia marcescens]HBI6947642.1 hypothetical protein [Serratia marcescens]
MKEQYAAIVAECLAAFDAIKRGEPHERANQMMTNTAAKNAAFLLPELRPVINKPRTEKAAKATQMVRIVGSCWEFPDGQRIPDFLKADKKAKSLGMVLERHQKWRFSETE